MSPNSLNIVGVCVALILLVSVVAIIFNGGRDPGELKASRVCTEAGLIPDTRSKPYRCVFSDNDPRLK